MAAIAPPSAALVKSKAPAPVTATSPMGPVPMTQEQMTAAAIKAANAQMAPQQQAITLQQQQAAQQALAASQAIKGFTTAADTELSNLAPDIKAAYSGATDEVSQLGQGFSTAAQKALQSSQDQGQSFATSQGQNPGAPTVDPTALHDALYASGAFVPGSSLAAQGAAAQTQAAGLGDVQDAVGRNDLNSNLATEGQTQSKLGQQLSQVAAQYPTLRDAALKALQSQNNQDISLDNTLENSAASRAAQAQNANTSATNASTQAKAEALYEAEFGEKKTVDAATITYKSNAQKIQVEKMIQSGLKVNPAASKEYGYIVDNTGQPVLDANGKIVSVKAAAASSTPTSKATRLANTLLGDPVLSKNPISLVTPGMYLAKAGATGPGVFPAKRGFPATTNDPSLATRTGSQKSFAGAQSYLLSAVPGLTRAQARSALNKAGWKPDVVRP